MSAGPGIGVVPQPWTRSRDSVWRRLDWALLAAVAALTLLGALLVWSATRQRMLDAGLNPQSFLQRHVLNAAIGTVLGTAVALLDHRSLRAYAPVGYVLSCAGLIAVLLVGTTINGAHSWIVLGPGLQVQPSELAKVALVVVAAMVLAEKRDAEDVPRSSDVVLVLILEAVPMGLIMAQPDFGTTMVFAMILLGVLHVSGVRAAWVAGLIVAGLGAGIAALSLGVLEDYQVERFTSFTDPDFDGRGAGYNTRQARIAIGSGGIWGKGLFDGSQTKGQFVPEQQTDFIFTVAGEELGLIGAGAIIVLLGILLWRGLSIAAAAPDLFGRLVATGVVSWLAFQSFVNIGMTLGVLPVTGLPLPFVSYGGSAMFANLLAVGLLQNVHLRSRER